VDTRLDIGKDEESTRSHVAPRFSAPSSRTMVLVAETGHVVLTYALFEHYMHSVVR
jgi:hypothetical protein